MCWHRDDRTGDLSLVELGRILDRLSRELQCHLSLGTLSPEEEDALIDLLGEARGRVGEAWAALRTGAIPEAEELGAVSGIVRILSADIDLAYRRLSLAA